jgi:hypothetical protein
VPESRSVRVMIPFAEERGTRAVKHPLAKTHRRQTRSSRVRLWGTLPLRRFSGNQFERYIPEAISVIGIESVCGYTAAEIGRPLGHHMRFSTVFEITAAGSIQ